MGKAKIGVIGAGWWATEHHIPNLKKRKDVELTSVCKLEADQLEFVKNKFKSETKRHHFHIYYASSFGD